MRIYIYSILNGVGMWTILCYQHCSWIHPSIGLSSPLSATHCLNGISLDWSPLHKNQTWYMGIGSDCFTVSCVCAVSASWRVCGRRRERDGCGGMIIQTEHQKTPRAMYSRCRVLDNIDQTEVTSGENRSGEGAGSRGKRERDWRFLS